MVDQESKTVTVTDGDGTEYDSDALGRLAQHLSGKFSTFSAARRSQETQWLQNLRQFLGVYDPETLKHIADDRSKAYPKLTRTKIMVIVARLMNLLFPQGDKSWNITSSKVPHLSQQDLSAAFAEWKAENPDGEITAEELDMVVREFARKAAEVMERHVQDQLQDAMGSATETDNSDFVALCRKVILSAAVYNVGVLKGPMTLSRQVPQYDIVPGSDPRVTLVDGYRPYFEAVDVWAYYPDMSARTFSAMEGEFERHTYTRNQVERLKGRDDFIPENIEGYLERNPSGDYTTPAHEAELDKIGTSRAAKSPGKQYSVVEWWGTVPAKYVTDTGIEVPEELAEAKDLRITAWFAGDFVIKLALNPLSPHINVFHKFVFDDSAPGLCGGSMTQIMRDSQMSVAASARMLVDNAAATCGPNLEIDLSKMVDGQDLQSFGPFRNYFTDGDRNASGHRAINNISVDAHMTELLSVMQQFLSFADMETFVGGYGDVENTPGEALRTSAGASMVLGNAALPFRDIVRSFDQFTVSVLYALIEWNKLFNDEIEYEGDLRPVAKGATSLIAKEVRAFTLDNLQASMTPEDRIYVDDRKLLEQRLAARDVPFDDIKATDDEIKRRKDAAARRAQEQEQDARMMMQAQLKEIAANVLKDLAQAKKNMDSGDSTTVTAISKLLEVRNENSGERPAAGEGGTDSPGAETPRR